jgi:catechol 2,3-dioxygenase-like lactoylglutathione lyase family enzyme
MERGISMKAQISLVTIWTDSIDTMKDFYANFLGFPIALDLGGYVEFKSDGVRFAICLREVMASTHETYRINPAGQSFELAFPCDSPDDVDRSYDALTAKGASPVQAPQNMPWNQRTAFFADPDGNIHELFADIP